MRRGTILIEAAFVFSLIGLSTVAPKESKSITQVAAVSTGPRAPESPKTTSLTLRVDVPGSIIQTPPTPEGVKAIMGDSRFKQWGATNKAENGRTFRVDILDYEVPLKWVPIYDPKDPSRSLPLGERLDPEPYIYGRLRGLIPMGQPFHSQHGIRVTHATENGPYTEIFHHLPHPDGAGYVAHQLGNNRFTNISGKVPDRLAPLVYPVIDQFK